MKPDWLNTPAYQGHGWKERKNSLREDLRAGLWNTSGVNSEWSRLEAVALYKPRQELRAIRNPERAQHLRPVIARRLSVEYKALVQTYRRLGIRVVELNPELLPKGMRQVPPNLMFVRDLFVNTPEGAVIGRMASRVRAGEEKFAAASLATQGIPIRATIGGRGLFEGADALWLTGDTVLCGVGARTNKAGFAQLKEVLKSQGVRALPVPMPKGVQHLLGLLQLPGPDMAVVRVDKAPTALVRRLRRLGFEIVPVHESDEVLKRQGMNFVTVDKMKIIMAGHCPELRRLFKAAGLTIAAEVPISQLCNAAGGLACATGIVSRRLVK